jgi:homoaconitate hydratase
VGQTVVEKVAQSHMAEGPQGRSLRAGDFLTIRPHHVMTHDNSAPVMKKFRGIGAERILHPEQPVFILDHDIQNRSAENLAKYGAIEQFARQQGIDFFPAGTGIGHQVMIEQQYALPETFVVASDSHANMYGGIGAIGTPVVRTDAAAIWAGGTFWWQIPRTIQVVLHGELRRGVSGKDVILALCGQYNSGEALNAAVEFSGAGAASLSLAERLSIANMTTEWGALTGWFEADETTLTYIGQRRTRLAALGVERVSDAQLQGWRDNRLRPDTDARYAGRISLDLALVTPHVSGPDSVQVATPLPDMEAKKVKIDKAYLVSCVNSREQDLAEAAAVLEGRKIAEGVEFYVAAASREVQDASEQNGAWQKLTAAGAHTLPPGCGPCIGLGAGLLEPGEVGISATNRNFKGRMGSREAKCFLASPAVVAASALAGEICGPSSVESGKLPYSFEAGPAPESGGERVEILEGFPERISGRLLFLPEDNLNTDGIYGKDYTYHDDMTREKMAQVLFENYDPTFAGKAQTGDVILAGRNFGTGSSREQAVTALQAKGIALVIAGSYSRTYLRNAFNNGFPCVECPDLVDRIRQELAGEKTIVPGDSVEVDFALGTISYRNQTFSFPPLGAVPQALVIAGGVENQVRQRLGLK